MSATKGWRGKLRIADSEADLDTASDEPYIERVETNIDGGLEALYQLGSRLPQEINEGNVSMSVRITKKYVDNTWDGYAGIGQTDMLPPTKYLGIYPMGYESGKPKIILKGKFTSWNFSEPQDDYVVETLEFIAESITVGVI